MKTVLSVEEVAALLQGMAEGDQDLRKRDPGLAGKQGGTASPPKKKNGRRRDRWYLALPR